MAAAFGRAEFKFQKTDTFAGIRSSTVAAAQGIQGSSSLDVNIMKYETFKASNGMKCIKWTILHQLIQHAAPLISTSLKGMKDFRIHIKGAKEKFSTAEKCLWY